MTSMAKHAYLLPNMLKHGVSNPVTSASRYESNARQGKARPVFGQLTFDGTTGTDVLYAPAPECAEASMQHSFIASFTTGTAALCRTNSGVGMPRGSHAVVPHAHQKHAVTTFSNRPGWSGIRNKAPSSAHL